MSLSEAVIAIAEGMEEEAKNFTFNSTIPGVNNTDSMVGMVLKGYARQIRIAVKASGGDSPKSMTPSLTYDPVQAAAQHREMIDKYKTKKEETIERADFEDNLEPTHLFNEDGDLVPVHPKYAKVGSIIISPIDKGKWQVGEDNILRRVKDDIEVDKHD